MDYFRNNNGFTPRAERPGFSASLEHNWMFDVRSMDPDYYLPSYRPPQGPATALYDDHNVQHHPWVHPVNNYAGPERVD
jgi:hypothetical protein